MTQLRCRGGLIDAERDDDVLRPSTADGHVVMPESVTKLTSLEILELRVNLQDGAEAWPEVDIHCLLQLTKLQHLTFYSGSTYVAPSGLSNLSNLTMLGLGTSNVSVAKLDVDWQIMTTLQRCTFEGMIAFNEKLLGLAKLQALTEVDFWIYPADPASVACYAALDQCFVEHAPHVTLKKMTDTSWYVW